MKGIWRTNPGGDTLWPDWIKFHATGVTRIYIPLYKYDTSIGKFVLNSDELNASYREGVESKGFEYATYSCWNWINAYSDPVLMANEAVDIMNSIGGVVGHMFNDETHNANRILTLLKAYRVKKKTGPLSWALEGMQGGWFSKTLVNWINSDINCVVVPESFTGDMIPLSVSRVRGDLIKEGIKSNRVKVFYDASKLLSATWDGCLLSEETLR